MKALIGIVLVASLALTGCVSPQRQRAEASIQAAAVEVQAGRMKESEYWTRFYNAGRTINDPAIMKATNYMIQASLAYESGKITRSEYDAHYRNFESYKTAVRTARNRANSASLKAGLASLSNVGRQSINCSSNGVGIARTVTCY